MIHKVNRLVVQINSIIFIENKQGPGHKKIHLRKINNRKFDFLKMPGNDIKKIYYHCTRCERQAGLHCVGHRTQILKFYGNEIVDLPRRRRFQCLNCFRIGYTSERIYKCSFCTSTNSLLILD